MLSGLKPTWSFRAHLDKMAEQDLIRDVWEGNLEKEMANIRSIVEKYPYISMVRKRSLQKRLGAGSGVHAYICACLCAHVQSQFSTPALVIANFFFSSQPSSSQDTEFPGVVTKPQGDFRTQSEYQYKSLCANVNLLKLIQLGISFYDAKGNVPSHCCSWQFNFKFNLKTEMFSQDSIDLLNRSGIQFQRHEAVSGTE